MMSFLHVLFTLVIAASFSDAFTSSTLKSRATSSSAHRSTITSTTEEIVGKHTEDELVNAAKEFITTASGFYSDLRPELYSSEFVMRGPVIGPINKSDYCFTMSELKIWEAFPDIQANPFGFSIDPENKRKVWFFVRNTGTNTGSISFGSKVPTLPPTNKSIRGPTEAFSMEFDDELKLKALTIGYPCNRFEGNTGGLGAFIGLLTGCGLNFLPSPTSPVFKIIQKTGNNIPGYPKTFSNPEDLPSWWETPDVLGADGL